MLAGVFDCINPWNVKCGITLNAFTHHKKTVYLIYFFHYGLCLSMLSPCCPASFFLSSLFWIVLKWTKCGQQWNLDEYVRESARFIGSKTQFNRTRATRVFVVLRPLFTLCKSIFFNATVKWTLSSSFDSLQTFSIYSTCRHSICIYGKKKSTNHTYIPAVREHNGLCIYLCTPHIQSYESTRYDAMLSVYSCRSYLFNFIRKNNMRSTYLFRCSIFLGQFENDIFLIIGYWCIQSNERLADLSHKKLILCYKIRLILIEEAHWPTICHIAPPYVVFHVYSFAPPSSQQEKTKRK